MIYDLFFKFSKKNQKKSKMKKKYKKKHFKKSFLSIINPINDIKLFISQ